MSRTITVSTDVFAALWAKRQEGEETEDSILRRLLGCATKQTERESTPAPAQGGGIHDTRNGVHFQRGFSTFRNYKRREFEAVAQDGAWLRKDTGDLYPTLNQLNASITAGNENIWNGNWKYRTDDGVIRSIATLRC